jgi:hypothetical protein
MRAGGDDGEKGQTLVDEDAVPFRTEWGGDHAGSHRNQPMAGMRLACFPDGLFVYRASAGITARRPQRRTHAATEVG